MFPPDSPATATGAEDWLAEVFNLMRHIERNSGERPQLGWPFKRAQESLTGRSVAVPGAWVDVTVGYRSAADLGSFAADVEPYAITAHVQAFPDMYQDIRTSRRTRMELGDAEAEAWARIMFGPRWADYAYQLTVEIPDRLKRQIPPYQKVFTLLVDRNGDPMLAPDNYRWGMLFFSHSAPRKLEPSPENTELRTVLATDGPYTDSEPVRDPRTDPDGGWKIDVTGDPLETLTPTAQQAVEAARRLFRQRGAVNTHFQPTRLVVDGATLHVHFRWKKNPNVFATSIRIPQSEAEFTSPPAHNPSAWMSAAALGLWEELSTGMLLRSRRERIDGVIHLGGPVQQEREDLPGREFGLGRTVPGYAAASTLQRLGMHVDDAGDAHREGRLISWVHVWRNDPGGCGSDYLGHAVATWTDTESVASVDVIETLPEVPDDVVRRLVMAVVHDAADAGAQQIVTPLDHPALTEVGFSSGEGGKLTLDVMTMP